MASECVADSGEWLVKQLENLAARIRQHGCIDGEFGIRAESEDLEPVEINGQAYRNRVPTGRFTYTMTVVVDDRNRADGV